MKTFNEEVLSTLMVQTFQERRKTSEKVPNCWGSNEKSTLPQSRRLFTKVQFVFLKAPSAKANIVYVKMN